MQYFLNKIDFILKQHISVVTTKYQHITSKGFMINILNKVKESHYFYHVFQQNFTILMFPYNYITAIQNQDKTRQFFQNQKAKAHVVQEMH